MREVIDHLISNIQSGCRIAFLGVGSPLRADDSVGLYVVKELMRCLKPETGKELRFYLGESAPENFTGEIRDFRPTHLIIFDAAELGEEPGDFKIIEREAIGGVSFSTHMLPLKMLTDYVVMTTGCEVVIVGVQPENLEFGGEMSEVVKKAAKEFVEEFVKAWERAT
jgi:hydrogenase 3 maturation protease